MSTDPQATDSQGADTQSAGWADSLQVSRRALLRFLPRRLTNGHRASQAEIEQDIAATRPPATVTGGELNAHSPQKLDRFLARLESNAALAHPAVGTDPGAGTHSGKDDRGPEEEL